MIDTYMEEAQEELRSKRVKQSKGDVLLAEPTFNPVGNQINSDVFRFNSQGIACPSAGNHSGPIDTIVQ